MQLHIESPGLNLSANDQDYVETKMNKLVKYAHRLADESSKVKVELSAKRMRSEGNGVNCEVTIWLPGALIRAEIRAHGLHEAVDLVVEKLKKQLEKYKDKKKTLKRLDKALLKSITDYAVDRPHEVGGINIARRKVFNGNKSMTEDEAIEQMELLGHKFFLFLNQATDRYSVVYAREEADYGVIELDR